MSAARFHCVLLGFCSAVFVAAPSSAQTDHWEVGGDGWAAGVHSGTRVASRVLTLAPERHRGTFRLQLPELAFDSLVLSLNHDPLPAGCTVGTQVRVRVGEAWTPWLDVGTYGAGEAFPRSAENQPARGVEVASDLLRAAHSASGAELRLVLARGDTAPRIRRVAVDRWTQRTGAPPDSRQRSPAWGKTLDVPQRSQRSQDPKIAGRVCSPTSLSMVMAFWGRVLPTSRVAAGVHDRGADLFGNWSFNVAFASAHGLQATATHLDGLADLEREIAAGRPVVISHRYRRGELKAAPITETSGHLIVVVGFTGSGDVVVNDPAADPRRGQSIRRVYPRAEFLRSWQVRAEGIAYLLRPAP